MKNLWLFLPVLLLVLPVNVPASDDLVAQVIARRQARDSSACSQTQNCAQMQTQPVAVQVTQDDFVKGIMERRRSETAAPASVPVQMAQASQEAGTPVSQEKLFDYGQHEVTKVAEVRQEAGPVVPVETPKNEEYSLSGAGTAGAAPFHELSLWAGGWRNLKYDSKGLWIQGEAYRKYSPRQEPENFGLGLIGKAGYGWLNSKIDWGYYAVGPAISYWRSLTPVDEFQAKFRLPYRWDMNERGDGWMPGVYLEYARNLSRKNTLILSGEYWHFTDDSYLGFQANVEHYVNRTLKLKFGGQVFWSYLGDGTHFGWGPTLGIKLWDKLTLGVSLSRVGSSTMVGGIIGYDYNSALDAVLTSNRVNGVNQKEAGTSAQVALGDEVDFGTTVTNMTVADKIRQMKGETQ